MNLLLHREKYIQNKHIFFFYLFFLFFYRFKRFGCILKMLYLYETNKHFKKNIFHTLKPALYLFPYLNNLLTLTKLTLLTKKKNKLKEEGVLLFTLLYSFQYCFFFSFLFFNLCFFFQFQFYSSTLYLLKIILHNVF